MSEFGFDIGSIMGNTGFTQAANWNPGALAAYEPNWFDKFGYWMNNPTNQNMLARFGSAVSPQGSVGDRLGQAVAGMSQSQVYGGNAMKAAGPILASMGTPQSGLANPGTGAAGNTSGLAGGATSPDPFVSSPSFTLSSEDMRGMSPDQIKDVMGTAIEAKKFPLEVARINAGIDYTKASAEHMKALNAETARKAAVEKQREVNFTTEMDEVIKGNIKSKYVTPEDARILKAVGPTEAPKLIDNLINLTKETGKKLTIQKVGDEVLFLDSSPDATPGTRIVDRYSVGSDDKGKLPPVGYANLAYNHAISLALPALEAHYNKSFSGNTAKTRAKMQEINAMLGKDPNTTTNEVRSLLASAPPAIRDQIIANYNTTLTSMANNQGQILPAGILEYKKPVPKQNQFMLEGLPQGEPTPFDDLMSRYFDKEDMPMAKIAMKRESSFNPKAYNVNKNGTADYGLFQINEVNVPELRKAGIIKDVTDLYDADTNIVAASYLKKKYGWKPWKSSLGDLAEGKTASAKKASGWKGPAYYNVNGKKTAIKSELEYIELSGGK